MYGVNKHRVLRRINLLGRWVATGCETPLLCLA